MATHDVFDVQEGDLGLLAGFLLSHLVTRSKRLFVGIYDVQLNSRDKVLWYNRRD
jgi:hypothetical protein